MCWDWSNFILFYYIYITVSRVEPGKGWYCPVGEPQLYYCTVLAIASSTDPLQNGINYH